MKIKSFFDDLMGAFKVKDKRQNKIEETTAKDKYSDPITSTAKAIHPGVIELEVSSIKEVRGEGKTIRFVAKNDALPLFKAGQYLTLHAKIGSSEVTRPYSISSAPYQTEIADPYIEISVKRVLNDGFFSSYLLDETKVGDTFLSEIGLGEFCYNSLLDSKNIVAIAGGSGITPFLSLAREIKNGKLDVNLTIIHGSTTLKDIFLKEELEECICSKVRIIDVLSSEENYDGEKGFITKEIIKKYSSTDSTYFVCGPQGMYKFISNELSELDIQPKRIHFEVFGNAKDPRNLEGYELNNYDKTFNLKVIRGEKVDVIPALGNETIATALERAGLKIHTGCRSGICGFCRVKVLEGTYFVPTFNDQRRATDKEFNYVYSCFTYPCSDLTIKVSI